VLALAMYATDVDVLRAAEGGAKRVDPLIWLIPLVLSCIGILMVTSTTSPGSFEDSGTPFAMGFRQLRWLAIGMISMFVSFCIPSRFWHRTSTFFWIGCLLFVVLTLIPGVGTSVSGASRWIRVAGVSIQPAEVLTFSIVFLAAKLAVKNELDPAKCFYQYIVLIVLSCAPLLKQPDFGSAILVVMICMGMYVERFGWRRPLFFGVFGAFLLIPFIFFEPYRVRRVTAFVNPWQDPLDSGFQTIQGLIAFANGGAWGSGLGHGFQKLNYLPAAYTDFIYAALGEELGLVGTLGVMVLCLMWVTRGRSLYNKVPEGFETSVVWGVVLTIILPFFINIAGVTNLIPLTGMPLPFISYGGSALVMVWVRVGTLLRIQKESFEASE
jgi:cell division protein FtsW